MKIYMLIALMMLATYIPRLLPFFLIDSGKIPERLKQFLRFIPYAALGALILPGGLDAIRGSTLLSAAGLIMAAVLSIFRVNIVFSMVLVIAAIYPFI